MSAPDTAPEVSSAQLTTAPLHEPLASSHVDVGAGPVVIRLAVAGPRRAMSRGSRTK